MEVGKIYKVNKRGIKNYRHYFVFLEIYGKTDFLGVMLTHSKVINGFKNIPLSQEHFVINDSIGNQYEFQFDDSCFVPALLIKDANLPISEVKGELSESGLQYISELILEKSLPAEQYIEVYKKVFSTRR